MKSKINWMILGIIIILISGVCYADSFIDDTETEFDSGIYQWTDWRTDSLDLWGELPDAGTNSAVNMSGNVLLMHMNEASGTIEDTSGNNNDGTAYGGVTYGQDGKLDTALSFDGVNDYVDLGDVLDMRTNDQTLSYWIKTPGSSSIMSPVSKSIAGSLSGRWWNTVQTSGVIKVGTQYSGTVLGVLSVTSINDNQWHLITSVWDRDGDMSIYIDGYFENSVSMAACNGYDLNTEVSTKVGSYTDENGATPSLFFNGKIDEVSIWNRSLSADEILAIYNAQKDNYLLSGDYESKVFDVGSSVSSWQNLNWDWSLDWNFNEILIGKELPDNGQVESEEYGVNMSGNVLLMHMNEASGTIEDTSGNNNNGTASGGVTYNQEGKFDKALSFDGVDDYVDLGDVLDMRTNDQTLSYWLKTSGSSSSNIAPISKSIAGGLSGRWWNTVRISGVIQVGIQYSGSVIEVFSRTSINDNQWHLITSVFDRDGDMSIYIDGYFENSVNIAASNGFDLNTGVSTKVGAYTDGDGITPIIYFNGEIDEVAIWNRVLSADEILNYYKRGVSRLNITAGLNISAKSCDDAACDGETTWDKTCTTSPCDISTLANNQYIQYKVNMQSDGISTPEINNISIFYSTGAVGCIDNDIDGWGATGSNLSLCNYTASYDCNDSNADINPNAYDIPNNGIDEDCSGDDAYASYEAKIYFTGETGFSGLGYYIGDDVYYEVNFLKNNISSDEDVANIVVNLTDVWGNVLKSQTISGMEHPNTGNWTGMLTTDDISNQDDDKVNLKVYVYNSGGTLLDWRTHGDEWFVTGTAPSLISTAYTYLTDALSNHTVKDLVVNSSDARIDWSGSTLDLHTKGIDFDSALIIGDRSAYLDSSAYSELNASANLTFYNVNCASPYVFYSNTATNRVNILAENNQCFPPRCTNIECAGNTLTVTVSSFSGYAAESDASLTIDADDPKIPDQQVYFTADYRNVTDNSFISGASCTIYFTDGSHSMTEGATYTYNRSFATEGIKEYNVTCSKTGFSTLTAFDNATITSAQIPEFNILTLGIGLMVVLAGLIMMRKKEIN